MSFTVFLLAFLLNASSHDVEAFNRTISNKTKIKIKPLFTTTTSNDNLVRRASLKFSPPDENDFINDILRLHNRFRSIHDGAFLKLNPEMTNISQALANRIVVDEFNVSLSLDYGKNLFYRDTSAPFSPRVTAETVVGTWYNESENYEYYKGTCLLGYTCSHFTQLVWKSSTELGVGVAQNHNGRVYVVALYKPRGNIKGGYVKNVRPVFVIDDYDYDRSVKLHNTYGIPIVLCICIFIFG